MNKRAKNKITNFFKKLRDFITHQNAPVIALELAGFLGIMFVLAADPEAAQPEPANFSLVSVEEQTSPPAAAVEEQKKEQAAEAPQSNEAVEQDSSVSENPLRYYYLGQWQWVDDFGEYVWEAPYPEKTVNRIDLRSSPQRAKYGEEPEGYGFFVYPEKVDDARLLYLGSDLAKPLEPDLKEEIRQRLSIQEPLNSDTLPDIFWDILTVLADPTGRERVEPLMPDKEGFLSLYFDGSNPAKRERLVPFSSPEWENVQKSLWEDYKEIKDAAEKGEMPEGQHQKSLTVWQEKYHIDYKNFIPPDEPFVEPLPHQTVYQDDFNRADADALGTGWVEDSGDLDVLSNTASFNTSGGDRARYASTLSDSDHYAQCQVTKVNTPGSASNMAGTVIRLNATNTTSFTGVSFHYLVVFSPTYARRVRTYDAGTGSNLQSTSGSQTLPITLRIEATGSTIKVYTDGTQTGVNLTSSVGSGNLFTGLYGNAQTADDSRCDSFESGDLGRSPRPGGVSPSGGGFLIF